MSPRRARVTSAGAAALLAAVSGGACAKSANRKAAAPPAVESLVAEVVRSFPHDPQAFTQGLISFEGQIYESTGLPGRSSVRRVELETGRPLQVARLEAPLFGEGLARVGDRLVQLTWQDGKALLWNLRTLERVGEHAYGGEGWGLCHDGQRLVMSDGSDKLVFRDAKTFARTGEVAVARDGQPVHHLNELECVDGLVYANIWQSQHIARIDSGTGRVTGWIDAAGLLTRDESVGTDVLNGIAYLPERGTFLLTGKLWPRAFEVRFVRAKEKRP